MTRLDAINDPSMEDILASIRKIIAEDPPGSRPAPPAAPRAPEPPASNFAFGRPFMPKVSQGGAALADTPRREPVLSFGEAVPATSEFKTSSRGYATTEAQVPASPPWQDERSGDAEPEFQSEAEPEIEGVTGPTPIRSVDDQLSDLLDDVPRSAVFVDDGASEAAAQMPEDAATLTGKAANGAALNGATAELGISHPEIVTRPRFTVSRDGYVPAPLQSEHKSDPFDFDLGPSPFEIKAKAAVSAPKAAAGEPNISELVARALDSAGTLKSPLAEIEAIAAAKAADAAAETTARVVATGAHTQSAADAPVTAAAVTPKDARATEEKPNSVTPSVEVTLKPAPAAAAPVAAPRSDATPAAAPSSKPEPPAIETALAILEPASNVPSTHVRSMEDTVADLLRPLLKSWLAENMPKIVERALRREMTEQTHGEHKTAAE